MQGVGEINDLTSLNHPIKALINDDGRSAIVNLRETVDRSLVPCQDFVLHFRDLKVAKTSVIASTTLAGQQAVSIKLLSEISHEEEEPLEREMYRNEQDQYEYDYRQEQEKKRQELKKMAKDMEDSDLE